jgi:hypothetical protein
MTAFESDELLKYYTVKFMSIMFSSSIFRTHNVSQNIRLELYNIKILLL